jgi:hypothetical protein
MAHRLRSIRQMLRQGIITNAVLKCEKHDCTADDPTRLITDANLSKQTV